MEIGKSIQDMSKLVSCQILGVEVAAVNRPVNEIGDRTVAGRDSARRDSAGVAGWEPATQTKEEEVKRGYDRHRECRRGKNDMPSWKQKRRQKVL